VRGQLTPEQEAGKKIYTKGVGSSDFKIMANMSGVDVPATIMPCVNCHNARGTGNPEGGITPSNITWQYLTKNYEVKRQDGKTRPAYDEKSLRKVITKGIDPAGNQLHTTMPRYKMTRDDIDNLIAYIKVLGSDFDKGLSKDRIKLGFHLPDKKETTRNQVVRDLVNAYVQKMNSESGIYSRKLEVKFLTEDIKNKDEVFMITGFDDTRNSNQLNVPTLMLNSKKFAPTNEKNLFYIYPSQVSQTVSLVDYGNTLESYKQNPPAILYYPSPIHEQIAKKMQAEVQSKYKVNAFLQEVNSSNSMSIASNDELKSKQVVHFVGPHQVGSLLLSALDNQKKYPQVLVSSSVASVDVARTPSGFKDRIFIGFPTWITTRSAAGFNKYRELQETSQLSSKWKNLQFDALTMLLTIEKGLKNAGINVDREAFQQELEGLYEFSTGLMQPITFTSNKHVGSEIVYITSYNAVKQRMELKTMISSGE